MPLRGVLGGGVSVAGLVRAVRCCAYLGAGEGFR